MMLIVMRIFPATPGREPRASSDTPTKMAEIYSAMVEMTDWNLL
jgi:hypothetical protein